MSNLRLIARLDIKAPNLIKGIHLEGFRVIGDPNFYARQYYEAGADELIYIDVVASLYERNSLVEIVEKTTKNVFVPLTVGGGVRSVNDARTLLRHGADKVAINTAAINKPELITELANQFGSQCIVLSIEAKRQSDGTWGALTNNGRDHSNRDVLDWVRQCAERGVGEILLTSVDQEGTRRGFDIELTRAVSDAVSIPVIASGGMGQADHFVDVVQNGHADAVAFADILHFDRMTLNDIRAAAKNASIPVRKV